MTVAAREAVTVPLPAVVTGFSDAATELVIAMIDGAERGFSFPAEPRDSGLAAAVLTTTVTALAEQQGVAGPDTGAPGYRVEVVAGSLVRDLALLVDRSILRRRSATCS